ncbi:hypothetical protein D9757_000403 [Collybiopsis confluens]|uniref:PEBP-like protein n=1 Tax=Collybiopsis confluens TaxID=2823264 RepID=A0A8H5MH08_9AGAR|nr:hypothetical protein D9757_000403 [Collybiopsis confluens]
MIVKIFLSSEVLTTMRFFSYLPYLLPLFTLAGAQDVDLEQVKFRFQTANIPLDIDIPSFDPTVLFELAFPQKSGPSIPTTAGDFINQNQTAGPPTFGLEERAGSGPFVVAMVDLDAPDPRNPTEAQIRHFLGGNFRVGANSALVNSTPAVTEFLQPNPPVGSEAHRYVFLVFKQSAAFNNQKLVTPATSRDNFDIAAFATALGLGSPIAGTYIVVNVANSTTPADV